MFCRHKDLEFIGNIHGDLINDLSTARRIYRSAHKCKKCGWIVFKEELDYEAFKNHHQTYNDYLWRYGY